MLLTAKAALRELLDTSLEIIGEYEESNIAIMEDYADYDCIEPFKQRLAMTRKRFEYLAGIVEGDLSLVETFELTKLQLIQACNKNCYLRWKLEKVRHEKHVYKVEMNRCRRKLEAVYKFCDSMMFHDWKGDFSMCRKKGWL